MSVLRAGIKLGLFVVVSVAVTLIVSNTVTRPLNASTYTYHATFPDASGLKPGDEVDIAGVRVGKVTGERLRGTEAYVTFEVVRSQPLTTAVHPVIRYADLLGARFLSLVQQPSNLAAAEPLRPGATLQNGTPALSLTVLFNGFKPLFSALSPSAANQLAADVVAAFQGEGGSIVSLLHNVGTLTKHLSDRDALIGSVIDNLNSVLGTVSSHRQDLAVLIEQLKSLTSGLSADRNQIANALGGVDAVARSVAGLVKQANPAFHHDIGALYQVSTTLVANEHRLGRIVHVLPDVASLFTRGLGYGSWLNAYVCGATVNAGSAPIRVVIPGVHQTHSVVCR